MEWSLLQERDIRFIYISTDQVYNNIKSLAVEGSEFPINFYGMSKLWSEDIVCRLKNHFIIRTNFFWILAGAWVL